MTQPSPTPTITANEFVGWFLQPDDLLGWTWVPCRQGWYVKSEFRTWVQISPNGFRGEPFPGDRIPGVRRILLLADSFGAAVEIDAGRTFAAVLKQRLAERLAPQGTGVELLNASVGGYGTEQEYLYFRERGKLHRPDLVLVAFHFGDDLLENSARLRELVAWRIVKLPRPYLVGKDEASFQLKNASLSPAQVRRSWQHYYDPLSAACRQYLGDRLDESLMGQAARIYRRLNEAVYRRVRKFRAARQVPFDLLTYTAPDALFEASWQHTAALFGALKGQVERAGARLAVAGLCAKPQVVPGFLEAQVPLGVRGAVQFDPGYPNRRLRDILHAAGIPYFDLTPAFHEEQRAGRKLFFERDLHWNEQGHALAGETLAAALEDMVR